MTEHATELQIHRAAVQWLQLAVDPLVIWFHPANGGYRRRVEARILKGMGLIAGVSDLVLIYRIDLGLKVLFIEIKAEGGRTSESQHVFAARCAYIGAPYEICRSLEDVMHVCKAHGVPMKAQRVAA